MKTLSSEVIKKSKEIIKRSTLTQLKNLLEKGAFCIFLEEKKETYSIPEICDDCPFDTCKPEIVIPLVCREDPEFLHRLAPKKKRLIIEAIMKGQ